MTFTTAFLPKLRSMPLAPKQYPAAENRSNDRLSKAEATLDFSIVSTRSGFDSLENDWCDLFARAAAGNQVFQSFHWLWHWCNHFHDETNSHTKLAIVTGRKAGQLVLVWPLVETRVCGLTSLSWMGHPVSQYGDALIDPTNCTPEDLQASWHYLIAETSADEFLLRKVREDSPVNRMLKAECKAPISTQRAPYLDFSNVETFDAYQTRYSSKARKNRRRLRRRAEERAPLTVATYETGPLRAALAERAVILKRCWLQARGLLSPALQDERTQKFFADAAKSEKHPTGCRTTALHIGDETAAIEVSFIAKQHCAVHIIVYHMEHEKAGAGVLLMEDAIDSAIRSGVKTFDLMAPGDNYKLDWADGVIEVHDWSKALSRRGHVFALLNIHKTPALFKAVVDALPLKIRQLLHRGFACTR